MAKKKRLWLTARIPLSLGSIEMHPDYLAGAPRVKGTRVSVSAILERLSSGDSLRQVAKRYNLTVKQVRDAILFAAEVCGWLGVSEDEDSSG